MEKTSVQVKRRLCFVVSSEITVKAFLIDQLRALSGEYQLAVVANTRNTTFLRDYGIQAEVLPIAIERRISPIRDLAAFTSLVKLLRDGRFDAVHSISPKAGLLAMLAGFAAGVPLRTHTFTGQVWATRSGPMRLLLKNCDRLLAAAATRLLADSHSQRSFLESERVARSNRITVLAHGSISGVDLSRFHPDEASRIQVRNQLNIPANALVFIYVGRMNHDKGVLDLALAFAACARENANCRLLLVGPDEESVIPLVRAACATVQHLLHVVSFTSEPERYMAAADVLCLCSYREGFGSVIIEAAATGIPSIASRIYGLTDAVIHEETGILHEPRDVAGVVGAMRRLAENYSLRMQLGENARRRARDRFSKDLLTNALVEFYGEAMRDLDRGSPDSVRKTTHG